MKRTYNTLLAFAISASSGLTADAQRVEYFWDTDPGVGKGQVLQTFTGTEAAVEADLDVSTLTTGIHKLGLRALNDTCHSATYYRSFFIPPVEEEITRIEYGWDTAPSVGGGTAMDFIGGSTVELTQALSTSSLGAGVHTLFLRTLSTGHYSQTYTRTFYVPETPHAVEAIEYFFDDDPGVGYGTLTAATMSGDELAKSFSIETEGLSPGVHLFGIRTLTDGTWSATKVRQFLVSRPEYGYITRLEYFWNTDPGIGSGTSIALEAGEEVTLDFNIDMTSLEAGTYVLGLRAQSGAGFWSNTILSDSIDYEELSAVEGDVNGDGTVDVADIATIIDIMAGVGADPVSVRTADVNGDGTVDVADIASVISIMAARARMQAVEEE